MMRKDYLLRTSAAEKLYAAVAKLPIIDYHCHLSPKEIAEDAPFTSIGELWLGGDHYKWRLMRAAGVEEKYITGDASYQEKFRKFAGALSLAAGSPLYHWAHMELSLYFGIDDYLTEANADEIWEKANSVIRKEGLSPRSMIRKAGVAYLATTDDVIDSLEYHKQIREDKTFDTVVAPSFRTDNVLLIRRAGYADYAAKLSAVSGVKVEGIASLKAALVQRLNHFCENNCRFTDIGIPDFPSYIASEEEADATYRKALAGEAVSDAEYSGFLGNMYLFLGKEYKERNLVMQWHLAVYRNASTKLFTMLGPDCGGDCVGDPLKGADVIRMLDAIEKAAGAVPQTILYTLHPGMADQLQTIAGSFRGVRCGTAWWFCDHRRGIEQQIEVIAELGHLGSFLGMLTDSRSFLSYARHDYFRRILCNKLAQWCENGEFDSAMAETVARRVCCENIKTLIGG